MPKIVIREFDKTKAGVGAYANFAVVVPGFCKEETIEKENPFDEYGVFECSEQGEFKTKIGVVSPESGIILPSNAPSAEVITKYTVVETVASEPTTTETKELSLALDTNDWKANLLRVKDEVIKNKEGDLYYMSLKDTNNKTVGYLRDETYNYNEITEETDLSKIDPVGFAIIATGNEGNDEKTGYHYGNQIAYELLGLGYTVLYKKLDKISDLGTNEFWDDLKDKALYDFRYVLSGLLDSTKEVNNALIKLVTSENGTVSGRGDCIALVDIPESAYKAAMTQEDAIEGISAAANELTSSQYAALLAPTVTYLNGLDTEYKNFTLPASFHYLACAAKASEEYSEWYAVAGYNRGLCNYTIKKLGCNLGEAAINALEPRYSTLTENSGVDKAINLIVKIKNSYYLWGNRTAYKLGDKNTSEGDLKASHFLNIRQLCTTIKKQVYVACRKFTFDPNSDILWVNFCNSLKPTLEKMKADQGISDYRIVKLKNSKKALLAAAIRIVPIEAVEDFDISIYLEDSLNGELADIEIAEN